MLNNEQSWKQEWSRSPLLRAEFKNNRETFLAYKRGEDRGVLRILPGKTVTLPRNTATR